MDVTPNGGLPAPTALSGTANDGSYGSGFNAAFPADAGGSGSTCSLYFYDKTAGWYYCSGSYSDVHVLRSLIEPHEESAPVFVAGADARRSLSQFASQAYHQLYVSQAPSEKIVVVTQAQPLSAPAFAAPS